MNVSSRRESGTWHEAYRSEALSDRRRRGHLKKLKRLNLFELNKSGKILDICCGEGEVLELLAEYRFKNLFGVDLALPGPGIAAKPYRYMMSSANCLPIKDASMDCVICTHSLHHLGGLDAVERFLSESMRVLNRGGKLVIIDHYDSLQLRIAFGLFQSPLANLTAFGRNFRQQLIEEHDYLYDYLDHWKSLSRLLTCGKFGKLRWEKDLFFFYAVLEKGHAEK